MVRGLYKNRHRAEFGLRLVTPDRDDKSEVGVGVAQLVGAESVHFPQCLAALASAWGAAWTGRQQVAVFTSTQGKLKHPRTVENNVLVLTSCRAVL